MGASNANPVVGGRHPVRVRYSVCRTTSARVAMSAGRKWPTQRFVSGLRNVQGRIKKAS
jgi:hypothetical protein